MILKKPWGCFLHSRNHQQKMPTRHDLKKKCTDDRKALEHKINSAYHLAPNKQKLNDSIKKWEHASYIVHTADIFGPSQWLAVALLKEIHDPVKAVCYI